MTNRKVDGTSTGIMLPLAPEQYILSFNIDYKVRNIWQFTKSEHNQLDHIIYCCM